MTLARIMIVEDEIIIAADIKTRLQHICNKDLKRAIEMALYIAKGDTERENTEKALKKAKIQFKNTLNAFTDWITIIDNNFNIIYSNQASGKYCGKAPRDIVGKSCYEIVYNTNGAIMDCPLQKAFKNRHREDLEFKTESGHWWYVWVNPVESIYHGNKLALHVVKDITDNKFREQKILIDRKAKAFSILAGGLAHDYNNLLTTIWGNISLLKDEITDPTQNMLLEETEKACESARSLTHKFLYIAPGNILTKIKYDIEKVLNAALRNSSKTENVLVSCDLPSVLPSMKIDFDQILVAFRNIIVNALEAMPEGGKLNIRAKIVSIRNADQQDTKFLEISFEDTGKGIPEAEMIKVFDPYFTTKAMGSQKGVGLGLAVAKAIIDRHGGNIHIDSDMGKGATVIISLPMEELV